MSAGRYDIKMEQGTTFDLPINYKNPDGSAIDLSSYSAHMQVREAAHTEVLVEFTSNLTSNGFIFMSGPAEDREDSANGNVRIYMSAANTSATPVLRGRYDLELSDATGYTIRLLEGQFEVEAEITR